MQPTFRILVVVLAMALISSAGFADCVDYTATTHWVATPTGGDGGPFAIVEGYAYLAGFGKFRIADVSDPEHAREVGTCDGYFDGTVSIRGNVAYVPTCTGGIAIIDISDRTHPAVVNSVPTGESFVMGAIIGNCLCVMDSTTRVHIYDLADPVNPVLISAHSATSPVRRLESSGSNLYVVADDVEIVDLSVPESPRLVGAIDTPSLARCVAVDGFTVYACVDVAGLCIYDVTRPQAPVELGRVPAPSGSEMVVADGTAYIIHDELYLYDIHDQGHPRHTGVLRLRSSLVHVDVVGPWLYTTSSQGLSVWTIGPPEVPSPDAIFDTSAEVRDLVIAGDYAYTATPAGPYVIDVTDPATAREVGLAPTGFNLEHVRVDGNRVFALGYYNSLPEFTGALAVFDVSTPTDPRQAAEISVPYGSFDLAVAGNVAYVAAGDDGLLVVDLDSPDSPPSIIDGGSFGSAMVVAVSGLHLFVGDTDGLMIFTIADPLQPRQLAGLEYPEGCGRSLALTPAKLLACGPWGVSVFDIFDERNPRFERFIPTPGHPMSIVTAGMHAYCIDYTGLGIIELTEHAEPEIVGYTSINRSAVGAVTRDHLVLGLNRGLAFQPLQCESSVASPRPTMTTWPNPLHDEANVRFTLARGGRITARVYDVAGRAVRTFFQGDAQPGTVNLHWDSRDDDGRRVPAGVYLLRVESGEGVWTSNVVRVR